MYDLFTQSKAIMFYSVPHKGSSLADFTLPLLRRSIELLEIQRSKFIVCTIDHDNETNFVADCNFVLNLHKQFLEVCEKSDNKPEIFSFIETSFTLMSFVFLKIVAYDSAGKNSHTIVIKLLTRSLSDPNIGVKCDVPLDHREICKPAGRDCFLYLELVKLIKKAMNLNEE